MFRIHYSKMCFSKIVQAGLDLPEENELTPAELDKIEKIKSLDKDETEIRIRILQVLMRLSPVNFMMLDNQVKANLIENTSCVAYAYKK